ncbi:TOMM precursor leader peptide-binding protein [Streptomyces sp. HNM0645]|uniref:TOMM precursor leader peptide-binding protein n=1 Tax=Streptomyces sp. HNM0645 TaxID=2782343 RepID=UPI0024B7EEEF|nr:TOMM precursor leader peptide-binding protein [Streptomyces sp. HNM0645]MDI9888282.1 TOMM precursor leader peptide-binding protein [Streptomyces sp. HNM0645]
MPTDVIEADDAREAGSTKKGASPVANVEPTGSPGGADPAGGPGSAGGAGTPDGAGVSDGTGADAGACVPEKSRAGRTPFDALAATRPRIRRDVLFTETPGGVLFHNADGGFHLTGRTAYRFASLMVPHLTGDHSLAELCSGFGAPQRGMAAELVRTLYERDFARDVPLTDDDPGSGPGEAAARRYATQIAYVDHYTDRAPERFRRFRDTAVAVLGDDEVARWCALSLVRNGCAGIALAADFPEVAAEAAEAAADGCPVRTDLLPAEPEWPELADYDTVVVTGAGAARRVHRLLAAGVPEGKTLIPVWTFGELAVTGPLATAGSTGCWSCALLRLGANHDAGAAAALWSEVAGAAAEPGRPAGEGPLGGPVAAMTGNLLAYEVFRIATGALPAETDRQVLLQNLQSLDVVAEPLLPHPRCSLCGPGRARSGTRTAGESAPDPLPGGRPETTHGLPGALAVPTTASVETARDAEDTVDALNRTSTALVGAFTGVFARFDDESLTQTPLKAARLELALAPGERRTIAAFDVHHLAGARTRALRLAAETYVEHVVPVRLLAGAGADLPAVAPAALTTGAGSATASEVAAWVPATSLLTGERVKVPAAAVRPFGPYNRERIVLATSAGAGSGGTDGEAAGSGLLSAVAHDALLCALRGTARTATVTPDDDPELVFLLKSAVNLGIEAHLLDLGEDARTGGAAVLAREAGGPAARWAVAAGLSRREACCAALRDLLGSVQLTADDSGYAVDTGDPLVPELAAGTLTATAAAVPADAPGTTFDTVLDRLRASGRDALYVPTTPCDLPTGGIATARVLLTRGGGGNGTDAR